MIDLDWLDEQLEQALSDEVRCARQGLPAPAPTPAPLPARRPPTRSRPSSRPRRPPVAAVPAPRPQPSPAPDGAGLDISGHARRVEELLGLGHLHEADLHIAAHAFLADRSGRPAHRRDAAALATLRALLDGREADARAGSAQVLALGREAGDPDAWTRYLVLRYRIVLEWGTEDERDELLDQCRARAYWFDEAAWRGALTLLLARLGKAGEAAREFDLTLSRGPAGLPEAAWLDVTTDLAEAAAVLGDAGRASIAARALAGPATGPAKMPATGIVVAGRADVCKGPVARYRALAAAVTLRPGAVRPPLPAGRRVRPSPGRTPGAGPRPGGLGPQPGRSGRQPGDGLPGGERPAGPGRLSRRRSDDWLSN